MFIHTSVQYRIFPRVQFSVIFYHHIYSDFKSTHKILQNLLIQAISTHRRFPPLPSSSVILRVNTNIVSGRWRLVRGLTSSHHLRWYCEIMIRVTCIVGCHSKVAPRRVRDIPFLWEVHAPDFEEIPHGSTNVL